MIKISGVFWIVLLYASFAMADAPDSAASITLSKENFQFVFNPKANKVEIKHAIDKDYTSNIFNASVPVIEMYNDEVTIDGVGCKVDNHKVKDFNPQYANYSVGDVFYTDAQVCYFPLNFLKKGTKGEVLFDETILDPRYFTSVYFTEELPVTIKVISFKVPRWMKVELKEYNFAGFTIVKTSEYDPKEDADIITYTAQNMPPEKSEANSPGPSYLYPHIMVLCKSASTVGHNFTYFATLDDQYAWYRELVNGIKNDNAVIAAKAKELTAGLSNDMDKIKAIFYYVQDNIRYVAFENGIAGFKPQSADEVLRRKYGDCKGMANLTKSLLTSLGYDARLCWLGTNHIAYDYQTPSMAVDNHMICALNYKGKIIYLDATESYLGLNEYAERIQGRQVLMENGDKYALEKIPFSTATQNYDGEKSTLVVNGTGLAGKVDRVWKGEDKESVLSGLNGVKKEKFEEAMTRYLSGDNNDYQVKDLKLSSTGDPDKDLTADYTIDYKNSVSVFGKEYYVDLDPGKELINSAIKVEERKHDYWFDYKMNISKQTELAIPANYKVAALPSPLNIVNPDYEFHVQYQDVAGKLVYKKSLLIKNTHMSVSKFTQWNKDIEQLAKTYNETVTLKPLSE